MNTSIILDDDQYFPNGLTSYGPTVEQEMDSRTFSYMNFLFGESSNQQNEAGRLVPIPEMVSYSNDFHGHQELCEWNSDFYDDLSYQW